MKESTQLLMRVILLIIVISLCFAVYTNGKSLSCDKCILNYKETHTSIPIQGEGVSYKLSELFEDFKEGRCLLK